MNRRFAGTYHLHFQGRKQTEKVTSYSRWLGRMSCQLMFVWFSTLKNEVICFSETSFHIRTIRRYIPGDVNFHNQRCKNLKSYLLFIQCYYGNKMKKCFIRVAFSTNEKWKKYFWTPEWRRWDNKVNRSQRNMMWYCVLDSDGSGQSKVTELCEYGKEHSGSTIRSDFLRFGLTLC
jgi:hypothetical protein